MNGATVVCFGTKILEFISGLPRMLLKLLSLKYSADSNKLIFFLFTDTLYGFL